ncbi:MAG: site-specific integrase [Alphaproteobacteria bacterium]|nr:site-specific integrase [Alphaproteobacteria bacterium]
MRGNALLSPTVLAELDRVHGVRSAQGEPDGGASVRLWPWHRMTGHRRVKEVMAAAGVSGPHATAKGLRHRFGVAALERGIPITLLQKWFGHAKLATTANYGDAVGAKNVEWPGSSWISGVFQA